MRASQGPATRVALATATVGTEQGCSQSPGCRPLAAPGWTDKEIRMDGLASRIHQARDSSVLAHHRVEQDGRDAAHRMLKGAHGMAPEPEVGGPSAPAKASTASQIVSAMASTGPVASTTNHRSSDSADSAARVK